jgi:hypothetical protein
LPLEKAMVWIFSAKDGKQALEEASEVTNLCPTDYYVSIVKKNILCAQFHAKLPTLTLAQLQVNSSYRMSLLLLSPFRLSMLIFVVFKMYLFIPSY